jgi:hypothetical protein
MTRYRRTQIGWAMLAALSVSVISVAAWDPRLLVEAEGAGLAVLAVTAAILAAAILLFCSLTVTVGAAHVTIRFGLTPVRKRIRLADVASFEAVRNPWYFGWGIQRYGPGWLYNVSGFEAIEIVRTDGKELRIGTDDAQGLIQALSAAIGDQSHAPDGQPPEIARS